MADRSLSRRSVQQQLLACLVMGYKTGAWAATPPSDADGAIASFKVMHPLTEAEGHFTYAPLILGADGDLYGTLESGGQGQGTLVRMSPRGRFDVFHSFTGGAGGAVPLGLALGTDGNYYGTTGLDGDLGNGTFFRITPHGTFDVLYSFTTDAYGPRGLVLGADSHFYGVAAGGTYSLGCVFRISALGHFDLLHSFDGAGGAGPWEPPVESGDGFFYGTTIAGGRHGVGTVYRMHRDGRLKVLHSFHRDARDGKYVPSRLVEGSTGLFYGTTQVGMNKHGGAFAIDRAGALTVLHQFQHERIDGSGPWGLVQGRDGHLYGVTTLGGKHLAGEIFRITTDGVSTRLHSFDPDQGDGGYPLSGLVEVGDGEFYGVTQGGGAGGAGTIYRLRVKQPALGRL
jgi:uncharacterized repeat protein (TIGR03803 family)